MSKRSDKYFADRFEHLNYLPESILLDLARNEACPLEYRLTAVEIMRSKGFSKVNHPDLAQLLAHIEEEEDQFGASKKAHSGESGSKATAPESKTDPIAPVSEIAEQLCNEMITTLRENVSEQKAKVQVTETKSAPSASVTTATMFGRPETSETGE